MGFECELRVYFQNMVRSESRYRLNLLSGYSIFCSAKTMCYYFWGYEFKCCSLYTRSQAQLMLLAYFPLSLEWWEKCVIGYLRPAATRKREKAYHIVH